MAAAPHITFHRLPGALDAPIRQGHPGDAAVDLAVPEDVVLMPHSTTLVKTHVAVTLPPGYWALLKERSSIAKRNVIVTAGVIDNGYRGNLRISLANNNDWRKCNAPGGPCGPHILCRCQFNENVVRFSKGDFVAQLIPMHQSFYTFVVADEEPDTTTSRGVGGVGSTGK